MRSRLLRSRASVCHVCDSITIARRHARNPESTIELRLGPQQNSSRNFATQLTLRKRTQCNNTAVTSSVALLSPRRIASFSRIPESTRTQAELDMQQVHAACGNVLRNPGIPGETDILAALELCEVVARDHIHPLEPQTRVSLDNDRSAASALLSLEESGASKSNLLSTTTTPAQKKIIDQLSHQAYSLLVHPPVFITPQVLQKYVDLQYILQKPETLPEVFALYSSKPIPEEGSSPIKYAKQNPQKASNAVPLSTADRALQTAIDTKQLDSAINIVGSSYATKASRKAKFVRKGLLPLTALGAAPVAIYAVAGQFGLYQTSMDPQMATNMAFVGMLAYLGFTTTIGVVAVTTANDQMERVTWALGTPLRERWMREEERAAIDRIACAWGFRQTWRRGEEEGPDWDRLREYVGRKGMILDKSELMEGME